MMDSTFATSVTNSPSNIRVQSESKPPLSSSPPQINREHYKMSCTLVTAFYPIRSKFPAQQYLDWARNFLSLESSIVLFTEEHLVATFQALRPSNLPFHIITLPFSDLETWSSDYPEQWRKQHILNPEGHIQGRSNGHVAQQSPELYALWAHKPAFVERAIHINPFHTDYFFWCDIGAFREPVPELIRQRFPETKWLSPHRILLQAISPIPLDEKGRQVDGIRGPAITSEWNEIRLVGGLWGGGKKACLSWKQAYHQMLQRYLSSGRYTGNDQMVMLSTVLETPSLAIVVKPTRQDVNVWFFLEYLLSSLADFKADLSYL